MACENNDLAAIGGGEPFQCRLQALIIILCKAVIEDQREAGAGSLDSVGTGSSGQNTDPEWDGYWTLFSVRAV